MSVHIKGSSTSENYITNLSTRELNFLADEPLDKGGKDTAVTPMELIGGALSSCTIITLQMYFNHKGWEFNHIEVEVDFDYSIQPVVFKRFVKISGNFDEKQSKRIEHIANACPVHKLLEKGNLIETTIELV